MLSLFLICSVGSAIITAWVMATLVGLLRLRNWARYSILVIGGLLAFSGVALLGCTFLVLSLPGFGTTANLPRGAMRVVIAIEAVIYAGTAAIGVWWLVYFSLRSTISFFLPAHTLSHEPEGARSAGYHAPRRLEHVPAAVVVLASLFCLSALVCLLCAFLPFPAFLFGTIFTGRSVPILYITLALIAGCLGFGLFRLDNRARIATYVLMALGFVNLLLIFTPWYRTRMTLYFQQFYRDQGLGAFASQSTAFYSGPMLAFSAIFGIAVYSVIVWILYRYRRAFTHPPPSRLPSSL